MKYICTKFIIRADEESALQIMRELLADACGNIGYESFIDTDNGMEGYIQQDVFSESDLNDAVTGVAIDNVEVETMSEPVPDQDWNETWETEQGFEPVVIGQDLVVYDALHTDPNQFTSSYAIEIGIRARNAFGTGTHQTTRMMITSILSLPVEGKRVLDCGCGTGILGIVALKCRAAEVVAYDIDEWSAENTQYNAMLNGVSDHLTVYEGNANVLSHVSGMFDYVLANINRNILLEDMPAFESVMASGATLVISGFYSQDVPLLEEKAQSLQLRITDHATDGDWHCLILKKD